MELILLETTIFIKKKHDITVKKTKKILMQKQKIFLKLYLNFNKKCVEQY